MYQLKSLLSVMSPVPTWKTGWTAFTITGWEVEVGEPTVSTPKDVSVYPPSYPPFPGFAGDAWYWANGQWFSGIPTDGWYWYYGLDLRWHLCLQTDFEEAW